MKFKNGGRYCEREVYFAHSMLYHPDRFFNFAKRLGMKTEELCKGYKGLENDTVFLVQNSTKKLPRYNKLGELFEKSITADSLKYEHKNDYPPETGWNSGDAYFSFSRYMCSREENHISLSVETAYFGTEENKVSSDNLLELGHCFAKALKKYISEEV